MSHSVNIHDGSGIIAQDPFAGILLCYGTVLPTGPGYAPGSRFIKIDGTTIGGVSYINVGTKTSANFVAAGTGGLQTVSFVYGEALALDSAFWVNDASRTYVVQSITCRPLVAGTDAGAVTAQIRKVPTGTAVASGTALHTGTINLKGTINTNQPLTLATNASVLQVNPSNALGFNVTGVTTAARGVVTVAMLPL